MEVVTLRREVLTALFLVLLLGALVQPTVLVLTADEIQDQVNRKDLLNFQLISTVYLYPVADAYICEGYPNNNYGSSISLKVGKNFAAGYYYKSLLKFDLSSIPSNAKITSAKLYLTLRYKSFASGVTYLRIYIFGLSDDWSEGTVTWNNYPSGYYTGKYFYVYSTDAIGKKYEIDVTDIVQSWVNGSKPNYGYGFRSIGSTNGYVVFGSKESSYKPKLVVTYYVPSIKINVSPSSAEISPGESATYQVSVTSSGYSGNVQLSVSGLPSGAAYSFNPSSGTPPFNSILTVSTSSSTPTGAYTLTIIGVGSGVQAAKQVTLTVSQKGDFDLVLNPSSITLGQGTSSDVSVQVVPSGGYNKQVTLSIINPPSGITVTLGSTTVSPGSSTTLHVKVSNTISPGTYSLILKGSSDGLEHTKTLTINVEKVQADFSVSADPSYLEVNKGDKGSVTVNVKVLKGSVGQVSLSLEGLPSGSYSFSRTMVSPPGFSLLTIYTKNLDPGLYSIVIKGSAQGIEKSTTLQLRIKAAEQAQGQGQQEETKSQENVSKEAMVFDVAVSPTSLEMEQGETATLAVDVKIISGNPEEVTLSLSGLPAGVSYSFNPPTLKPPGTSTLTINSGSAKGTFTVIIKARSGSVEKSTRIQVVIKEKRCIIATTTYGSEVEPEVQFLRGFRDNVVLSTYSGQMFYRVFDPFYYSWSPYVAHYINENSWLKPFMRVVLYPLIWSLEVSALASSPVIKVNPEVGVFTAGAVASVLLGLVYVGTPASLVSLIWLRRRTERIAGFKKSVRRVLIFSLVALATSGALSLISGALTLNLLMMISTSMYVLSFMALGSQLPLLLISSKRIG